MDLHEGRSAIVDIEPISARTLEATHQSVWTLGWQSMIRTLPAELRAHLATTDCFRVRHDPFLMICDLAVLTLPWQSGSNWRE